MDDTALAEFEVSKLHDGVRSDGAPVLYILIKPAIDPEKVDYKRIVKGIINPLIPRLPKFSAYIYDDRQSLVMHYMYYTAQLGRDLEKKETILLSRHCIACYDQALETAASPHNLEFFPVNPMENHKHKLYEAAEYIPVDEGKEE